MCKGLACKGAMWKWLKSVKVIHWDQIVRSLRGKPRAHSVRNDTQINVRPTGLAEQRLPAKTERHRRTASNNFCCDFLWWSCGHVTWTVHLFVSVRYLFDFIRLFAHDVCWVLLIFLSRRGEASRLGGDSFFHVHKPTRFFLKGRGPSCFWPLAHMIAEMAGKV